MEYSVITVIIGVIFFLFVLGIILVLFIRNKFRNSRLLIKGSLKKEARLRKETNAMQDDLESVTSN